jgi:integrase/recombinase XerD
MQSKTPVSTVSLSTQTPCEGIPLARLSVLFGSWVLDNRARGHSNRTLEQAHWIGEKLVWYMTTFGHASLDADTTRAFLSYVRTAHTRPEGRWGEPGATWVRTRGTQAAKTATSARTIRNYWVILRGFGRWCIEQGEIESSPIERIKAPVSRPDQPDPLSVAQARALVEAAGRADNPTRLRDKALLLMMLDTGLRATELISLTVGDIDTAQRRAWIERGKGNKGRAVWWSSETNRAIISHLRRRKDADPGEPLFTSAGRTKGEPLTRGGLLQIVNRIGEAAGVDVHPHKLRHTYAVLFLTAGGQQIALKESLGHTTMEMTSRYVRYSEANRASAAALYSPVSHLKK